MESPPVPDPVTIVADDMFSPAGLAVALMHGCEIAVDDAPGIPPGTKIDRDDLTCGLCGGSIDAVTTSPAKWVAYNAVYNDGLCAACDPPNGEPWLAGLLFLFGDDD